MGAFLGAVLGAFVGGLLGGILGVILLGLVGAVVGFLIDAGSLCRAAAKAQASAERVDPAAEAYQTIQRAVSTSGFWACGKCLQLRTVDDRAGVCKNGHVVCYTCSVPPGSTAEVYGPLFGPPPCPICQAPFVPMT